MPSAKVVFTYKRKRLSSGSTVGDEDVYPGKIKAVKDKDFSKGCVSTDHERGLGDGRHTEHSEGSQSSLGGHYTPNVNISNDSISKMTEENSASTLLEETEKSKKDSSSFLDLGSSLCDKHIGNGSESQTENRDENVLSVDKRRPHDKDIAKSSDTSPLITFSRRLKRKADVLRKLPVKECTADEKNSSVSCQNIDANEKQVPYEDESRVCSRLDADSCARSRSEMILSVTVNGKSSDGVVSLDNVGSDKQILPENGTKLSASIVSEATDVRNPPKIAVGCLSSEQAQVSSYNDESKTDQGASNGTNSQLTSSDGSDSKVLPRSKGKGLAGSQASLNSYAPLADSLVIDCNASPESAVQEETDFPRDSSNTAATYCSKGKALNLFETSGERMGETRMAYPSQLSKNASSSSRGFDESRFCRFSNDYANIATNLLPPNGIASKSGCLQLFPEGRGSSVHLASTLTETTHTYGEQIAISSLGGERERTEHSLLKPPVSIGMSLQTDPLLEGHHRASKFQNFRSLNVGLGDPIQDAVSHHPFSDSAASSALRHKKLLNNINSRASALQASRFELSPNLPIWTEDELDSLWIGVRRHGRGNWDSMLRDPRLRFSPWRKASDLVQQWIIEQQKLVSKSHGQNPAQSQNLRRHDVLTNFDHTRPLPSHGEVQKNCAWADAQFSLGDLIPPKERGFFSTRGWAQNHVGIGQGSNQVASPKNNFLPHWLREAGNVSPLKPDMPFLGAASFHLQQPSLGPSTVLCGGLVASQLLNLSPVGLNHHEKNVLPRRVKASDKTKGVIPDASHPSGSKAAGIIVVDSDASSEETISDEHNNGHHRCR